MAAGLTIGIRQRYDAGPRGPYRPAQMYVFGESQGARFVQQDESAPVTRWLAGLIRTGNVFLLSGTRTADKIAFEIAHAALEQGGEVLRIPREMLLDYQLAMPNDDTSKVLVTVYRFRPQLFTTITRQDVVAWRAKHKLDQLKLAI